MLLQADAALIPLPDKSTHCVCCSPPYWGLRKYAGEQGRIWGGDPGCEHEWAIKKRKHSMDRGGSYGNSKQPQSSGYNLMEDSIETGSCQLCGAWYGALGLEPTPELHIEHMVEIFREIRRVLRDDGVVYLNYGDCFAGSGGEHRDGGGQSGLGLTDRGDRVGIPGPKKFQLPQGNLMLMPHKVAIALQNDGWIVRNDVIWFKRNPMPESVAGWSYQFDPISEQKKRNEKRVKEGKEPKPILDGVHSRVPERVGKEVYQIYIERYNEGGWVTQPKDSWRHTRAHEYIFQLTKKMNYYSNQETVREAGQDKGMMPRQGAKSDVGDSGQKADSWLTDSNREHSGRNPRSVLDVPTAPYSGAHYATFPPNLIAPLIRASCPKRCCPECGAPWAPVVEKSIQLEAHRTQLGLGPKTVRGGGDGTTLHHEISTSVIDYSPTCSCERDDHIPGIVLDPFIGSGTTGAVARELGRRWVGLDISMEYLDQQAKIRALKWTPSNALEGLPLFMDLLDE